MSVWRERVLENSKPLVIVLSRNYSTGLGVIRSLGAAGYNIDLIASTKKNGSSVIAASSKYVHNSVEVVTSKIQGDKGTEIMEILEKYAKTHKERMVLFPVDDFTTSIVDANREALKGSFCMPEIRGGLFESINQVMDKQVQGELARKVGLLTPEEWIVSLRKSIEIPTDIKYPCFVKPLQSISGHKTEMAVCNDYSELEAHLADMKNFFSDREVIVQEFLHIDKEYDLSGVCLDQKIIIPGVIEKTRIARYEQGVTMTGKMCPTDKLGRVKDKITEFLQQLHYVGMFDMELCLCGDRIYFNEVNFRSGGPNYFYFQNGVNLPKIFVDAVLEEKYVIDNVLIKEFGKTFVYEKVAWEDYIHSHISYQELKKCISEADFTLLQDKEDPEPGRYFNRRIRLSAVKHKMKNRKRNSKIKYKENEKLRVVVAGRNYCNILTMTRALGEAGYQVDVLRIYKTKPRRINLLANMEPDAYSKYVNQFSRCVVGDDKGKAVKSLIEMANISKKDLLIAVDDYTACIIDEEYSKLKDYYIIPNVNDMQGEICRLMDKNIQKAIATQYNVPMLRSVLVKSENGEFEIPESVHFPCFVKPSISVQGTKANMKKCDNEEELARLLSKYARSSDFEMLIEEYADIKAEYSLLGVCTAEGIIAPGLFKVIEGGHRERKGVTITGESISNRGFEEIIKKCTEFIQGLNYTGLFDVDFIETKDGKIYFIELNFRAGASMHLFTKTGINMPGMFADNLLKGKQLNRMDVKQSEGKRFVSEKVLLEEYARSDVKLEKMRQILSEADVHFIRDDKDPKPYKYFKDFYMVAFLMKIPYFIRDMKR